MGLASKSVRVAFNVLKRPAKRGANRPTQGPNPSVALARPGLSRVDLSRFDRARFAVLVGGGSLAMSLGACTQMHGQREAYIHSRQIIVEMDVSTPDAPVTRFASWPGPEHNLTLVRGDSLFPTEVARATPAPSLAEGMTRP